MKPLPVLLLFIKLAGFHQFHDLDAQGYSSTSSLLAARCKCYPKD